MSWASEQVAAATAPAKATYDAAAGAASASAANSAKSSAGVTEQTNKQIADIGKPYTSGGQASMNAYLDALGLSYETKAATAATNSSYGVNNTNKYAQSPDALITFRDNIGAVAPENIFAKRIPNALNPDTYFVNPGPQSAPVWAQQHPGGTPEDYKKYLDYSNMMQSGKATYNSLAAIDPTRAANEYGTVGKAGTEAQYSTPSSKEDVMSRFTNSPGYQAALREGLASVNSKASASGLLGSGSQLKALERYGSDYAQRGYQSYLGNLLSSASLGQDYSKTAASAAGQLGSSQIGANAQVASTALNAQSQAMLSKAKLQSGSFAIGNNAYLGMGK